MRIWRRPRGHEGRDWSDASFTNQRMLKMASKTPEARGEAWSRLSIIIIFILIFGLTVALSVNVTMFSTLRFFEGFCLAGVTLTLYALRK